ncbi:FAD dependent oxidoreductase [Schizophyllum amplum]|uniref:FAD dependent oxidoreductase n=1 Tax=Schizophyllum amplum TaxID=97359 RepID=A0A550C0H1_9AGAR|nr:FAD dependent oxidoreductase [Auriculariopsis ampla]
MSVLAVPTNQYENTQAVFTRPEAANFLRAAGLPVPNPTKSFWIDSAPDANPLAKEGSEGPLTTDADVCIIGSGMTGVSAAYAFSKLEEGLKVVILEARDFCSAATGRNGGHLTPALTEYFAQKQVLYGTEETLKDYALENYTASEIVKVIHENGLEDKVDLVEGGHITLLVTDIEYEEARADYAAATAAGQDTSAVTWMAEEEMAKTHGVSFPAVRIPAHNLWPLKIVTQLFRLASRTLDLSLHTRTPAIAVTPVDAGERRWSVQTPRGAVACTSVLHATNAYASHLLPHLAGAAGIVPTRGHVAALRAAAPLEDLTTASWDSNEGSEYWFPRPLRRSDKENTTNPLVIVGGGREVAVPTYETGIYDDSTMNEVVTAALRDVLPGLFPEKYEKGREPEMEWTGIMGFTKLGVPFVGPVIDKTREDAPSYEGQYISAGYTGHGMPKAYACGEAVASMIVADMKNETWEQPAWLPHRYLTTARNGLTGL